MSGRLDGPTDVLLADGSTALVRAIRPEDADDLRAFHARLSPESVILRFFGPHPRLSDTEVERFTTVDSVDRLALVAVRAGDIVAVARYDRAPGSDEAEVAFVVDDDFQGRGLGTILLEHLASAARARGIGRFVADTLSENFRMLGVFRDAGFSRQFTRSSEVMRVVLDISPTPEAQEAVDARDRQAVVHSMSRLLQPASIAVVGASRDVVGVGRQLVANLMAGGFTGPLYPVNPAASTVEGLPAWPSVEDIPGPVDVAVVAVPAHAVRAVVEACGRKGVGALVVVSAGFAETGAEGRGRQHDLVHVAHANGMRMVGPNCFGVLNTDPDISMNATLAPAPPVRGTIGVAAQAGGLSLAILAEAGARGLGLSSFVSLGNKADVSGNDALTWWEQDAATEVVLLYLESFGNPRRFSRIAQRISRVKPIVAVKSGRSAPGARGATPNEASRAGADEAVDALFRRTGVIRADTTEELFDVAAVLALQPRPRGRRVGIVGDGGGPGVLAADACVGHGLVVPELSGAVQDALRSALGAGTRVTNPVGLLSSASADDYGRAIRVVAGSGEVDTLLVGFTPPLRTPVDDVAAAVATATDEACGAITVVACVLGTEQARGALAAARRPVPCFTYPETAARALCLVAAYTEWRARPAGVEPVLSDVDPNAARRVVESWAQRCPDPDVDGADAWVTGPEAMALLRAYGISGGGQSSTAGPGVHTVAGFVQDQAFGPLVVFGLGGPAVELLGDNATRMAPLTDVDARELVLGLRGSALLTGYGGTAPADIDALADLLIRLGRMAEDLPELAEADCNPVLAAAGGATVVGARFRLRRAPGPADDRRRLP